VRAGEAGGRGARIIVAGSRLLGGGNTLRALPERAELDGCTAPLAAELMAGCRIVSQQVKQRRQTVSMDLGGSHQIWTAQSAKITHRGPLEVFLLLSGVG
jgi:hypothetical protein